MSERRFRRTAGGVCSLKLHLVWSPLYFAGSVGYVSGSMACCSVGHQWDAVA
ncbi:MAG TPA: hypothetical protein VN255_00925 [Mycobacterium sp.]|nr:hypothetical protein [Mycobacterium sp.]